MLRGGDADPIGPYPQERLFSWSLWGMAGHASPWSSSEKLPRGRLSNPPRQPPPFVETHGILYRGMFRAKVPSPGIQRCLSPF